jgi:hypothetical protein
VVIHEEPVADIAAVAVDGKRFPLESRENHARDKLLGVLAWAVVVGAVRDGGGEAVCFSPGADEMVGGGLRGGIGGIGEIGRVLVEVALGNRAVDFIGGDVVEVEMGQAPDDFKEVGGADDVGENKVVGGGDAPVDVGLGGDVDDGIDLVCFAEGLNEGFRGDIAVDEEESRIALNRLKVAEIGSVGEEVQTDEFLEFKGSDSVSNER